MRWQVPLLERSPQGDPSPAQGGQHSFLSKLCVFAQTLGNCPVDGWRMTSSEPMANRNILTEQQESISVMLQCMESSLWLFQWPECERNFSTQLGMLHHWLLLLCTLQCPSPFLPWMHLHAEYTSVINLTITCCGWKPTDFFPHPLKVSKWRQLLQNFNLLPSTWLLSCCSWRRSNIKIWTREQQLAIRQHCLIICFCVNYCLKKDPENLIS